TEPPGTTPLSRRPPDPGVPRPGPPRSPSSPRPPGPGAGHPRSACAVPEGSGASGREFACPASARAGSRSPLLSWAVTSHHLVLVQAGPQGPYGAVQPALDRALRHAELLGY